MLNQIEMIYVLGHSMSTVDLPYFQKIVRNLKGKQEWFVTYFKEREKEEKVDALVSFGVDKSSIHIIKLTEL